MLSADQMERMVEMEWEQQATARGLAPHQVDRDGISGKEKLGEDTAFTFPPADWDALLASTGAHERGALGLEEFEYRSPRYGVVLVRRDPRVAPGDGRRAEVGASCPLGSRGWWEVVRRVAIGRSGRCRLV